MLPTIGMELHKFPGGIIVRCGSGCPCHPVVAVLQLLLYCSTVLHVLSVAVLAATLQLQQPQTEQEHLAQFHNDIVQQMCKC
jgi:hypothetical protein